MKRLKSRGLVLCALTAVAGCYAGRQAARDVNQAWEGRTQAELEDNWGEPVAIAEQGDSTVFVWSNQDKRVKLPSADGWLVIEPGLVDAKLDLRPGEVWYETTDEVAAVVGPGGEIVEVYGSSLAWGPPDDVNLRWGFLFGGHVGFGRLDDTSTPLPSGGLYIGGMLKRDLGLVGTYSMVSGRDEAGGAMGFSWGLAPQWWVTSRFWLRGGPAVALAFDPGFEDLGFGPGVTGGASYALVRAGSFVLDFCVDVTASTTGTFGSVGVGVNIN